MNYIKIAFNLVTITLLMTISISAQTQQEVYQEYLQVSQQLQQIQQQALATEEIKTMSDKFTDKI